MSIAVKYYAGKLIYDLTPLVTSVTWSGDTKEASRSCRVALNNTTNGVTKAVNIANGADIRFYQDGKELFRGNIFDTDVRSDGSSTFTARDYNHYLTKNKDTRTFVKQKASQIVKSIAQKHGIAVGQIDDTGYVIPELILRNKTLDEMMTTTLTETKQKTGKDFLLSNEAGKLVLRERRNQVKRLIIGDGRNLINASYTESIEDLRNSVRLTGKAGEDVGGVTVSDSASIAKYGLMREKQHDGDAATPRLKPLATQILKDLNKPKRESNVEAFGDATVFAGKVVVVSETMTGMSGGYFVLTDTHTFQPDGTHKMALRISHWLELNEINYEPPEVATPASASSGSVSGGRVSGTSSSRSAVVSLGRSYIGKLRYVFGGKNIPGGSGDCSGFTNYIYKRAAGVEIGHGTSSQVGRGVKIATSQAQAGDLVFFQGTYRAGVSHVGIVTRPGYFVNLASSGCYEASYTSGYWGSHFMQIRKVLP